MAAIQRRERVDLELRDYLRVLRRQWLLIALVTVVCLAIGVGYLVITTPVYKATAAVLLDTGYSRTVLVEPNSVAPDIGDQVVTETDLMRSGPVLRDIEEVLGYRPDVEIRAREAFDEDNPTRIIDVISTSTSKDEATRDANDFALTYTQVRKGLIDDDLEANIEERQQALNRLDVDTAESTRRIAELDQQIPLVTDPSQRRILEAERRRLAVDVASDSVANRQAEIQARLDLLNTALRNNSDRGIFKVNQADVPGSPVSPVPVRDMAIALFIGLGLGIVAAFLRDYYDDSVRTKEELDRLTGGVPVLGIIPAVRSWRNKKTALLESLTHPGSAASEAYRSLRTSLEFAGIGRDLSLIHITSPTSGEGKSTTAANLAVSLARAGNHVVLVDCDLRRPRAHEFFEASRDVGFTSVLLGTTTMDQALLRIEEVPGLYLLPSGPMPPNPSELLDSEAARSRLRLLAQSADFVIIDSPPILPVSDSVILAAYTDATMVVVKARTANRRAINRTLELLDQIDSPAAGMVLNGVSHEATYGYGYGYGYGGTTRSKRYGRARGGDDVVEDEAFLGVPTTDGPDATTDEPHVTPPVSRNGSDPDDIDDPTRLVDRDRDRD